MYLYDVRRLSLSTWSSGFGASGGQLGSGQVRMLLSDSIRQRIRIRFKARRLRHLISLRASEASVLNHVDRSRPRQASSDDLLIKHAKSFAVPICVVLLTECSWFKLNFETSEIARSAVRLLTLSELGQPDGLLFQ